MSLRVEVPKGRAFWYIRGTVKAGRKSRSIYETTLVGAGEPNARAKAERYRKQREPELVAELLAEQDPNPTVTWAEAAADYGESRKRARVARNPALADLPDKELEYVDKWLTFFEAKGVAHIPLDKACTEIAQKGLLGKYFDEMHIAKGNKLSTMWRDADCYHTVMNYAADRERKWAPDDYPRCKLPDYDIADKPVNKWLHPEEIDLFISCAPAHLQPFVAGVFATGLRGGELIFCSRRAPDYDDSNSTGLSMEPGQEHVFLGCTKSGKPVIRYLPDWYVEMLHAYLDGRKDDHDALFLTELKEPYLRPRKQHGFIVKTAWKAMRHRVAAIIGRLARLKEHQGDAKAAQRLRARAAVCAAVTPHWGRHNSASYVLRHGGSNKAAQRAGGWSSPAMLRRYEHLAPEAGKDLANEFTHRSPRAKRRAV